MNDHSVAVKDLNIGIPIRNKDTPVTIHGNPAGIKDRAGNSRAGTFGLAAELVQVLPGRRILQHFATVIANDIDIPDPIHGNVLGGFSAAKYARKGIVDRKGEIDALVDQTRDHGGLISYNQNTDGTQSPYELNINYFDALSNPSRGEPLEMQIARFMAAQAIMLSLRGVPGIYFHSLFGSRNWPMGMQLDKYNRAINRQKLARAELEDQLADPTSLRLQVFERYRHLLAQRSSSAAFHPHGRQKILDVGGGVFAVLRGSPDGLQQVLCLQNITVQTQTVSLPDAVHILEPYQTLWLVNS